MDNRVLCLGEFLRGAGRKADPSLRSGCHVILSEEKNLHLVVALPRCTAADYRICPAGLEERHPRTGWLKAGSGV